MALQCALWQANWFADQAIAQAGRDRITENFVTDIAVR